MTFPGPADFSGRYILVADEDPEVVALLIRTLRNDGHAVFHAYDGRSAVELSYSLRACDLIISDTKVDGRPGTELIQRLRLERPTQPILYVANLGRSSDAIERQLPPDVPILRTPFTPAEVRAAVNPLLQRGWCFHHEASDC